MQGWKSGITSLLFLITIVSFMAASARAGVEKGTLGFGLNYSGLGVKYFPADKFFLEGKAQFDEGILAGGLRGAYYLTPLPGGGKKGGIRPLAGLEADYIYYKSDVSASSGYAGELFLGAEYFSSETFSFGLDIGPAWLYLKDKDTSLAESGWAFVLNVSIYWYSGTSE